MVLDQGFKVADICHQLEVGETALRRWVSSGPTKLDSSISALPGYAASLAAAWL